MAQVSKNNNQLTDSIKEANPKNPIAQILGIVLRRRRVLLYDEPDSIAKTIGVQASYYRAVEAGTHHLHISHALKLTEAFMGHFSYEAIVKILSTISITEAFIKDDKTNSSGTYYDKLRLCLEKISLEDFRMKIIYEKFKELDYFNLIKALPNDQVIRIIQDNRLEVLLEDFLKDYDTFGRNPIEIQKTYAEIYFKDVPTNQIEIFDHIRSFAIIQPTLFSSKTSWDWEQRNKEFFRHSYILNSLPDIITGLENLTNYRYEYLWEDNFQKAHMLFISDKSPQELKKPFKDNLRISLERLANNAINKEDADWARNSLKSLDEKIDEKVQIKCVPVSKSKPLIDNILKPTPQNDYNATWFFSLENKWNVGVRAIVSNMAVLMHGDYLKFEDSNDTLKEFNKIWDEL